MGSPLTHLEAPCHRPCRLRCTSEPTGFPHGAYAAGCLRAPFTSGGFRPTASSDPKGHRYEDSIQISYSLRGLAGAVVAVAFGCSRRRAIDAPPARVDTHTLGGSETWSGTVPEMPVRFTSPGASVWAPRRPLEVSGCVAGVALSDGSRAAAQIEGQKVQEREKGSCMQGSARTPEEKLREPVACSVGVRSASVMRSGGCCRRRGHGVPRRGAGMLSG